MNYLFLLVALSIVSAVCHATDDCQDDNDYVGTCEVRYHVCAHYDGGWKYQAEATEPESDEHEKSDWHSDSDTAVYEATKQLFKDLGCDGYDNADCNCQYQDVNQDSCHLRVYACYYFDSKDDVEHEKATYECTAYDSDNRDNYAEVSGYDDAGDCGNAASEELFKKYPDTGAKCGYGDKPLLANPLNMTQALQDKLKPYKYLRPETKRTLQPPPPYRVYGSTCTGPHEFCCEAPNNDPKNCPPSAWTSDCAAKNSCCCA